MKFEEIKQAMDQQKEGGLTMPKSIKDLENSQLPIEKVRKRMMIEIIYTLLSMVFFFSVPLFIPMDQEPQAMYLILMFVICTITVGYVLKMLGFHKHTRLLQCNSKDTIQGFVFDLKILLETYKTGMVAGSVLVPLPMVALFLGDGEARLELYHQLFSLDFTAVQLFLLALAYLVLAAFFYYITLKWSGWLYGKQINKLEALLKEYDEGED